MVKDKEARKDKKSGRGKKNPYAFLIHPDGTYGDKPYCIVFFREDTEGRIIRLINAWYPQYQVWLYLSNLHFYTDEELQEHKDCIMQWIREGIDPEEILDRAEMWETHTFID